MIDAKAERERLVAWIETETWEMEQGVDALLEVIIVETEETDKPWEFTGWQVTGVVQDATKKVTYPCTIQATPALGKIRFILPEASVNALDPNRTHTFNGLLISPSPELADDHHVAFLPVKILPRPARRPAP